MPGSKVVIGVGTGVAVGAGVPCDVGAGVSPPVGAGVVGTGVVAAVAPGVAVLAGGVELACGTELEQAVKSMTMTTATAMRVDLE
jgi:hypothetical protein